MNLTLKSVAAFFSAAAVLTFCTPNLGSGISMAEPLVAATDFARINTTGEDDTKTVKTVKPKTATASTVSNNNSTAKNEAVDNADNAVESTAITYTATAYALHGRTAAGGAVRRGIIAADPRVLPLGTQVRLSAGNWSGNYTVGDTGGRIKGRKIDVWVPNNTEARRFGNRKVKLTVLTKKKK